MKFKIKDRGDAVEYLIATGYENGRHEFKELVSVDPLQIMIICIHCACRWWINSGAEGFDATFFKENVTSCPKVVP